ncbi:MAG: hypothetical protein R2738_06755 [Bacteroides graminisolvens]
MDALRSRLTEIVQHHPKWDGRVANIQVTDTKERYKELRVLVSSKDASLNWDLRVDVREQLLDFIQQKLPRLLCANACRSCTRKVYKPCTEKKLAAHNEFCRCTQPIMLLPNGY